MKLDGSKFLNAAESLLFWKNGRTNQVLSNGILLSDAEAVGNHVQTSKQGGCPTPTFVPYTATVSWHTGARNLFSRFFPRYGNYCGPNYSSGRESGSLHWDKPPTDWVDYCCYRHDMGYDAYDQAQLLDADHHFLKCLQKIPETAKISPMGATYQNLYILGLQSFLIPYRGFLVKKIEEAKRRKVRGAVGIVKELRENGAPSMNRSDMNSWQVLTSLMNLTLTLL